MPDVLETTAQEPAAAPKRGHGQVSVAILNFWLDAALFVDLIFIMWVSAMLQLIFPVPTEAGGWSLWGLSYNSWRNVQFYSLCVFALLAIEHLVLHWTWVCSVVAVRIMRVRSRPDEGMQAIYGVGAFIAILLGSFAALVSAMAMVQKP